jgi:hypothetical protein
MPLATATAKGSKESHGVNFLTSRGIFFFLTPPGQISGSYGKTKLKSKYRKRIALLARETPCKNS